MSQKILYRGGRGVGEGGGGVGEGERTYRKETWHIERNQKLQ